MPLAPKDDELAKNEGVLCLGPHRLRPDRQAP
jgi:hypothetical protein